MVNRIVDSAVGLRLPPAVFRSPLCLLWGRSDALACSNGSPSGLGEQGEGGGGGGDFKGVL
jgi:hypothetical protein